MHVSVTKPNNKGAFYFFALFCRALLEGLREGGLLQGDVDEMMEVNKRSYMCSFSINGLAVKPCKVC